MTDIPLYIVAFVVALGILIVVHEFGHFWVAKRLGVKVLRFSIGFGKPLYKRTFGRDQTELVIAALPLGGFVKMLDETEGPVEPAEAARAFNRQPLWKRIPIVAAGPIFNFLFAILIYWVVYLIGIDGIRPVIAKVAAGSIAEQAGFHAGDEILAIDGKEVQSWGQRRLELLSRALDRESVTIDAKDADGKVYSRTLDLQKLAASALDTDLMEHGIGLQGYPLVLPEVGSLEDGPGKRAGLQVGDRVISIDGQPVHEWHDVLVFLRDRAGKPVQIAVERNGKPLSFAVTPDAFTRDGKTIGRIGVGPRVVELPPDMYKKVRLGPLDALVEATANTWSMSVLTLDILYRMVTLEISSKNISGPITIAQYAGQSAKIGLTPFLMFLAVISISLAVLNLLPVPVLDGGHLLFYAMEAIKGSPVSERTVLMGHRIGIALLAALMALAFYNDLTRVFQ